MWTLISIKQNKEVVKISGKRYDPQNIETETFTLQVSPNPLFNLSQGLYRVQSKFSLKLLGSTSGT